MRARWSSVRFRRRFYWTAGTATLVVSVGVAVALIGNTAKPIPDTRRPGAPWTYKTPAAGHLTLADRRQILQTSLLFIQTAVARKHLERAYDITAPELLQGMSRREWMTGNIPVVPFEVAGVAAWNLVYSYRDDVGLQFSLIARPHSSSTLLGKTFTIELKRPGHRGAWLVSSWSPTGISSATNDLKEAARLGAPPPPTRSPLSLWWLLLPVGMLAMIVLVPLTIGTRHWYLTRKYTRQYLSERAS